MLARLWKKRNTCALLVGMQIGAATMENSMEITQKIKNRTALWTVIPLLDIYLKEVKSVSQRDICIPMFIAALFTIAKMWTQPKCQQMNG